MSDTWSIISIVACFLVSEVLGVVLVKKLREKGVPYEVPLIPLLLLTFAAIYMIEQAALLSPASRVIIQLGMLYCLITAGLLFLLLLLRKAHYQTYIFIVNWLNR